MSFGVMVTHGGLGKFSAPAVAVLLQQLGGANRERANRALVIVL